MTKFVHLEEQKFDTEEPANVLIFGGAGSGKTTFVSTAAKTQGPLVIFDFDGKLKCIRGVPNIYAIEYRIDDPKLVSKAFHAFRKDFADFASGKLCTPDGTPFRSGCLDSATSFDLLVLHHFIKLSGKNIDLGQYATLPTFQDCASYYKSWLVQVGSIRDRWFFCTAHETMRETETEGVFKIQPMLGGPKTYEKLPSIFGEVWVMERKGDGTVCLKIHGTGKHVSNSMLFRAKKEIKNPTFEKVMEEARKIER